MNEEDKKKYLEEARKKENIYLQDSKKAFKVADNISKIGSFKEDDPETHKSFYKLISEKEINQKI